MKHTLSSILTISLLTVTLLGATDLALASSASDFAPSSDLARSANLPTQNQSVGDIAITGIRAFMQVLGIIALVLILYAGFTMLISGGNTEKIDRAKNILIWTSIGGLVILSSLGILEYIDAVFYA